MHRTGGLWSASSATAPARPSTISSAASAPEEGDIVKLPALAATLKAIAKDGPRAFYEGPIAEDMVTTLAALGSVLTAEDFARHRGEAVTPISTNYRGIDLVEIPPNTQGLTALVTLNMLENFDLPKLDPLGPDRFHLMLEAARMGYAVRDTHIAEPSRMRVAAAALNDKAFAKTLAAKLDRSKRVPLPAAPTPGSDTVYLTVVDRDRRAISIINSLYSSFGTAICTEKTGIMFNNRGSGFVLDPGHPNTLGPSQRPMHTIIPALAMRDGRCDTSFGVMGAHYQPMGHVQMVLNLFDYGMDIQSAIDAPRAFFEGESTVVERGMPAATDRGTEGARPPDRDRAVAVGRRAGDPHRLEARRADRRLRAAQGWLRAWLLKLTRLNRIFRSAFAISQPWPDKPRWLRPGRRGAALLCGMGLRLSAGHTDGLASIERPWGNAAPATGARPRARHRNDRRSICPCRRCDRCASASRRSGA